MFKIFNNSNYQTLKDLKALDKELNLNLDTNTKSRIKAHLLERISITPQDEKTQATTVSWWHNIFSRKLILSFVFLIAFLGIGSTAYGSSFSLPGEPLYIVKQVIEKARLETAITDYRSSKIEADIAQTRIEEYTKLQQKQRTDYVNEAESEASTRTSQAVEHLSRVQQQLEQKGNTNAAEKVKSRIEALNNKASESGLKLNQPNSNNNPELKPQVQGIISEPEINDTKGQKNEKKPNDLPRHENNNRTQGVLNR